MRVNFVDLAVTPKRQVYLAFLCLEVVLTIQSGQFQSL
jgi:hypothetical protein